MTLWTPILLAAVLCVLLKTVGYLIPARWFEPPRAARIADLLTVALLGALVATQTAASGQAVLIDARMPAVAVAVVLLRFRASFLAVVVAAAAVAALLRLLGGAA
ncbi:AzlD domain-containing protein [Microbacterium betulae]|uniref:AzlD domain-containing protein n=1 Tax=Microbacterium betulae TaxID=2981139 RepID=A0AA97I643_9MICO|nr:AzlD domain-containing protein [Microbacterium sp. AB]WOF24436.1 AzlD domain-containing protein [Microbacterium sp. AB]